VLILAALQPLPAAALDGVVWRSFSPAERLGGELTLQDLNAPPQPAIALAEKARQRLSPDPFAALPEPWQRPWRQLRASTPRVRWHAARRVVTTWPQLLTPLTVPLLLHSDGTADVFLDGPGPAAVSAALTALLDRLTPPPAGSVQPLLLELQPRPAVSSLQ